MKEITPSNILSSSFRDTSGFLFLRNGILYRQINYCYKDHYDQLMYSGLYSSLVKENLLVAHEEIDLCNVYEDGAYKIIQPHLLEFISYPYEWCFSQLKDAALTTLAIEKKALTFGLSLKDASAYNIQFLSGKPIFIDTLSFENYREGTPWVAYRQFCQHFLVPLALMSFNDSRLNQLLRIFMDGIPLDLAIALLPSHARIHFGLLLHIYLHARSQKYFAGKVVKKDKIVKKFNGQSLLGLIDSLESTIKKLHWEPKETPWAVYSMQNSYSPVALLHKQQLVQQYLDAFKPATVWDIGAHTGFFSRMASQRGITTIAFDIDPAAVELNYLKVKEEGSQDLLPLTMDFTNPSPSIGWGNKERLSFFERGPADLVFALALIHHLVIANNVPFDKIACSLSRLCKKLVIEFIPKNDSRVAELLAMRDDIFPNYTLNDFESEFTKFFTIYRKDKINDSERTLYAMVKR